MPPFSGTSKLEAVPSAVPWAIAPYHFILKLGYCENGINTVRTNHWSCVTSWGPVRQLREDPGRGQPTFEHLPYVAAHHQPHVLETLACSLEPGLCSAW